MDLTTGVKVCPQCKESKPYAMFPPDKRVATGCSSWCRLCKNAHRRRFERENAKHVKEQNRRKNLRIYGLTPEAYELLYNSQAGECLICGERKKQLCVDHCHHTGKVRGLLCRACNFAIGLIDDDPDKLERAVRYLRGTL
jgi:hypothetical protein